MAKLKDLPRVAPFMNIQKNKILIEAFFLRLNLPTAHQFGRFTVESSTIKLTNSMNVDYSTFLQLSYIK